MFIYWDGFIKIQQGLIQRTSHSSISYFPLRRIIISSRSSCRKYSQFLCYHMSVSISLSNVILLIYTLLFALPVPPNLYYPVVMHVVSVCTRGCTQSFLPLLLKVSSVYLRTSSLATTKFLEIRPLTGVSRYAYRVSMHNIYSKRARMVKANDFNNQHCVRLRVIMM